MSNAAVLSNRIVLADLLPGARVRDAVLIAGGAGLTGLAAQASIIVPSLSPVPFTLQGLSVLVVGAALGSVRGVLSILLYLAVGLAGVPWFSSHTHGITPSFGYIIGFVLAAGLVGALAKRGADRHIVSTVAVLTAGTVVIYLIGTVWLAADLHLGAAKAFDLGVRPFLITDGIKVAAAALALPAAWQLVRRTKR